jgi:hypothetical protein
MPTGESPSADQFSPGLALKSLPIAFLVPAWNQPVRRTALVPQPIQHVGTRLNGWEVSNCEQKEIGSWFYPIFLQLVAENQIIPLERT